MGRAVLLRLMVALLLVGSTFQILETDKVAGNGGLIIADHAVVDQYDDIPQQWIDEVKKMYLNVPGESHSQAYREGLVLLQQLDSTYQVINKDDGPPEPYTEDALRVDRWVYNGGSGTGEAEWYTWHAYESSPPDEALLIKNHLQHCHDNGLEIAAIGFGWCWDMTWRNSPGGTVDPVYGVRWAGSSDGGPDGDGIWGLDSDDTALTGNRVNMDDYLQATEEYIQYAQSNNISTVVFFTTGPVDCNTTYSLCPDNSESGYQRYLKQEHIRNYVNSNSKVLFDYADILSYNDAGQLFTNTWDGHVYPQIHPDNEMDYDDNWNMIEPGDPDSGDHIGEVGALRLGKALWWLLARLAGWDGTPAEHINITISGAAAAGIDFGSQNPGATDVLETHSDNVTPSITVTVENDTNVNVDLQIKGDDFDTGFTVDNAKYNTTCDAGTAIPMSTSYDEFANDVAPGNSVDLWHWLDVPSSGVTAGDYTSTFSYKAVAH